MFLEERLSKDKHFDIVKDFSCGADNPLNMFLSDDAFEYDESHYGNTYVLSSPVDLSKVLGYYTLKAGSIQTEEDGEYNSIPAVEIARIALSFPLQGKGIGNYIFYEYLLPKIKHVADLIAVKAIIAFVDPDDKKAIKFYKSIGFSKAGETVQQAIEESFNEKCDLYLVSLDDIKDE